MTLPLLKSFNLKVELFAGIHVNEAAADLCELANRIGVRCEADFNGVKLWARPGDDPARLAESWDEQMKQPANLYRIAQAS